MKPLRCRSHAWNNWPSSAIPIDVLPICPSMTLANYFPTGTKVLLKNPTRTKTPSEGTCMTRPPHSPYWRHSTCFSLSLSQQTDTHTHTRKLLFISFLYLLFVSFFLFTSILFVWSNRFVHVWEVFGEGPGVRHLIIRHAKITRGVSTAKHEIIIIFFCVRGG
jgi:hypothetical protein